MQAEIVFAIDQNDGVAVTRFDRIADHDFYRRLREWDHHGLVLFSSRYMGKGKAVVHASTT